MRERERKRQGEGDRERERDESEPGIRWNETDGKNTRVHCTVNERRIEKSDLFFVL